MFLVTFKRSVFCAISTLYRLFNSQFHRLAGQHVWPRIKRVMWCDDDHTINPKNNRKIMNCDDDTRCSDRTTLARIFLRVTISGVSYASAFPSRVGFTARRRFTVYATQQGHEGHVCAQCVRVYNATYDNRIPKPATIPSINRFVRGFLFFIIILFQISVLISIRH